MFNPKKELSESQGSSNNFPKLNIALKIDLKEKDGGGIVFSTYDKEEKVNKVVEAPIEGIFIGAAMQLSSYSDHLGNKGGNYKSDYYVTNKNLTLFAPTPKGYQVVCKGDSDTIEAYIQKNSTSVAKKRQVLFILTASGLVAIVTNLSIAIDQITKYKEALQERYLIVSPELFKESSATISKKAKEYLGKFRQKNPPKYAEITVGEFISEQDWNNWSASDVVKEFKVWKEFKLGGHTDVTEMPKEDVVQKESGHTFGKIEPNATPRAEVNQEPKQQTEYIDDLPF